MAKLSPSRLLKLSKHAFPLLGFINTCDLSLKKFLKSLQFSWSVILVIACPLLQTLLPIRVCYSLYATSKPRTNLSLG
uniref:Uncharacterized protein n=1 Tax=Rhizophora mucronata TaxID=61149 RepID=A0A2P2NJI4_RHIMU